MHFQSFSSRRRAAPAASVGGGSPLVFFDFDTGGVPFNGYNDGASIQTTQAYSGTKSCRISVTSASTLGGISQYTPGYTPTEGDEVWFRIRTFFPAGFDFSASPKLKFLRIDTGSAPDGHGSHLDWYILNADGTNAGYFNWILEGVASWLWTDNPTTPLATGIVRDTWQTWEVYYKLHSSAGSAAIRLWRDGVLICDTTANLPSGTPTRATLNGSTHIIGNSPVFQQGYMHVTYWNGGAPATESWYVDDFTVYTSLSGLPSAFDAAGNRYIGMS
jgi:hypothetical protein